MCSSDLCCTMIGVQAIALPRVVSENDVGLHDFRHADRGSMLRVKGQDGFLPLGPALVKTGDEIEVDVDKRSIHLAVSEEELNRRKSSWTPPPPRFERGYGAIVNVASVGGLKGATAGVAYTASKHALIGLTRNTAWVYAKQGIRCNAVCPGGVQTNIGVTAAPRDPASMAVFAPMLGAMMGMAQPDDIATLISWLASDEARNVNGAVVADDGGWSAG